MSEKLSCGHPLECASEMLPDFIGDTPATQRIGTVHCRWCEDLGKLEETRRERDENFAAFTERCNAYYKLDMKYKILTDQLTAANKALLWLWNSARDLEPVVVAEVMHAVNAARAAEGAER